MDTIGDRFRLIRKLLGYTQEKMAVQLDVSRQIVSEYENNHTHPGSDIIEKYSILSKKSKEWIFTGTEDNNVQNSKVPVYRANQSFPQFLNLSNQQLQDILKLKETNPNLYFILDLIMNLNNQLSDKIEELDKELAKLRSENKQKE